MRAGAGKGTADGFVQDESAEREFWRGFGKWLDRPRCTTFDGGLRGTSHARKACSGGCRPVAVAAEGKVYNADKVRRKSRERAAGEGGTDQARDDAPAGSLSVSALAASATPPVLMRQALPEQHVHDAAAMTWPAAGSRPPAGVRPPAQGIPQMQEVPGFDRLARTSHLFDAIEARVIPRLVNTHGHAPTITPMRPDPAEIDDFFACLLADDVAGVAASADAMIARGLSAESVVLDVLVACARRLGQRWSDDCSDFVAVTVATGRLHQELRRLSPVFCSEVQPRQGNCRVLLAQPPDEAHLFGLAVVAEFFRRDGWDVVGGVAGAVADPADRVRTEWFDVVGLSVGSDLRLPWLTHCVASMRQASCNPHLVILVGGPVFSTRSELPGQIGADLCADAVSAPALSAALVAKRQQNASASHSCGNSH